MNKFLNKILFKKKIIARNLYNLYNIQELLLKMFKAEIEFYKLKKLQEKDMISIKYKNKKDKILKLQVSQLKL